MVAADIGEQLVNEATDQSSRGVNPSDELRDDLQEDRRDNWKQSQQKAKCSKTPWSHVFMTTSQFSLSK